MASTGCHRTGTDGRHCWRRGIVSVSEQTGTLSVASSPTSSHYRQPAGGYSGNRASGAGYEGR